jgi:hypothetical protein
MFGAKPAGRSAGGITAMKLPPFQLAAEERPVLGRLVSCLDRLAPRVWFYSVAVGGFHPRRLSRTEFRRHATTASGLGSRREFRRPCRRRTARRPSAADDDASYVGQRRSWPSRTPPRCLADAQTDRAANVARGTGADGRSLAITVLGYCDVDRAQPGDNVLWVEALVAAECDAPSIVGVRLDRLSRLGMPRGACSDGPDNASIAILHQPHGP